VCKEDFRLGEKIHTTVRQVAIDTGVGLVVAQPSRNRVSIAFSCVGDAAGVAPKGINLSNGLGIVVPGNAIPVVFLKKDWGDLVNGFWNGATQLNPATLIVTEAFLDSAEYQS
jgi:hypothetical protein